MVNVEQLSDSSNSKANSPEPKPKPNPEPPAAPPVIILKRGAERVLRESQPRLDHGLDSETKPHPLTTPPASLVGAEFKRYNLRERKVQQPKVSPSPKPKPKPAPKPKPKPKPLPEPWPAPPVIIFPQKRRASTSPDQSPDPTLEITSSTEPLFPSSSKPKATEKRARRRVM